MTQLKRLVLSALLSASANAEAGAVWNLVWEDNGNGAANTLPDASKWRHDTGGGGWGNNELQYYTNRVENTRYDGSGNLVIEARAEAYGGRNYTSGRLLTAATFTQAYGRFEARMRLPYGQGIWPAFWMLGNNIGPVGWPTCGEIDIMEMVGYAPNSVFGTLHGPGYSGGAGIAAERNTGSSVSTAFHEFAVEWEPNIIRWTMDGVHWLTRTPGDLPGGAAWVFDHPHFMLLNLAVGGNWPGNPDGSTVFSQFLTIDYVRVYSRNTNQRPYNAVLPIPGTVQAEDFDLGGPGISYNDTTTYHPGGVNMPRFSEQPDLEACTDAGGGYDLGWTVPGEWLEYSVNVAAAGDYALRARVASQDAGGTFRFELDGAPLANSTFTIPNTGGWQTWNTLGPQTVTLPAGEHTLRLVYLTAGPGGGVGNLNWFSFESLVQPSPTRTASPPPSATRSATRTASRTATPSATASATLSATRSVSPSSTSTGTASPSPTVTPTATLTASATASPMLTPTPSSTLALGSPTATPTASQSWTASPSLTGTPTGSPSSTLTSSATPSSTVTASPSPGLTQTVSGSPSGTPSPTPSLSSSPTLTSTPSATATATAVVLSPTFSPTRTAVPPTPVPTLEAGEHQLWPLYNPQRGGRLEFRIFSGGLERARLRAYSPAMVLLGELDLGPLRPGWHAASLPADHLALGLVWARLSQDGKPLGKPVRILRLPN